MITLFAHWQLNWKDVQHLSSTNNFATSHISNKL